MAIRRFDLDKLIGQEFGNLKIIGFSKAREHEYAASPVAICQCTCGNVVYRGLRVLLETHPTIPFNCGCLNTKYRNDKQMKRINSYIGKVFGDVTIEEYVGDIEDPEKNDLIRCRCSCGNVFDTRLKNLLKTIDYQKRHPTAKISCTDCSKKNRVSLIFDNKTSVVEERFPVGAKIDMLTVIGYGKGKKNATTVKCKCECGNVVQKRPGELDDFIVKYEKYKEQGVEYSMSCGCKEYENRSNTIRNGINKGDPFGKSRYNEKLYKVFKEMIKRCYNPNAQKYALYGGRGIYVCDEWRPASSSDFREKYMTFRKWAYDNGYAPDCGLSIDRIDNDGPYAPWNCRWTTMDVQASNTSQNKHIRYNGKVYTYSQFLRYMSEQSGHEWKMIDLHYYIKRGLSLNQMVWNMLHPDDKVYIQSAKGHHMNKRFQGCLVDKNGFARLIPKYDIELLD